MLQNTDRKSRILNAALKLFAEDGYHHTSLSKIAKEAGVSKGLAYNYFHSKEDLLNAILDKAMEKNGDIMGDLNNTQDAQEKMKALINSVFLWLKNHFEYSKMLVSLSLQVGQFEKVKAIVQGKLASLETFYAPIFKEIGFDKPLHEAMLFAATLEGITLQYVTVGEAMDLESLRKYLIEKYCKPNADLC